MLHFCVCCHLPCLHKDLCNACSNTLPWATGLQSARLQNIGRSSSLFLYEGTIRGWIHRYKYGHRLVFSRLFANLMVEEFVFDRSIEAIVPVPLHWRRLQQRGFNQSLEVARFIAPAFDQPLLPALVQRRRNTPSQTAIRRSLRHSNVGNAFRCQPHRYGHILLIDDVITTGATCGSVARSVQHFQPDCVVDVWSVARNQ